MKTSVVMNRPMGVFNVEQRTKDGMFNATSLIKQWNEMNGTKRELKDYLNNIGTQLFIQELKNELKNDIDNQQVPNRDNSPHLELIKNETNTIDLKSDKDDLKMVIQTSKGNKGGTWVHPLMFVDFAMWLNPKLKVRVLKFLQDELISLRDIAGDNYKVLTAAVSLFKDDKNYAQVAVALNHIVFHNHYEGIRQNATVEQLRELKDIQSNLAFAIRMGYIKNFPSLIEEMRRMYIEKYCKF